MQKIPAEGKGKKDYCYTSEDYSEEPTYDADTGYIFIM
ncbi:hypothetical protein P615_08195 [Brevibacillus laterosporus PE36]|nr:hypothetical protein P615_08195 [Brevibacillus laterosporus PE36]